MPRSTDTIEFELGSDGLRDAGFETGSVVFLGLRPPLRGMGVFEPRGLLVPRTLSGESLPRAETREDTDLETSASAIPLEKKM